MKVKVSRPSREEMEEQGVGQWPVWEKEVSRFDWHYDSIEECFLLEGEVMVETPDGEQVRLGAGDFVTFPKGMDCVWDIRKAVKKHYRFIE